MHPVSLHMKVCDFSFLSPTIPLKSKVKIEKSWRSDGEREAFREWPKKLVQNGHLQGYDC